MLTTTTSTPADKRNKVCTAIGKRIKAVRIAAGKSQEALAIDAELDRTYISQIERGVANPSLLTLANLCYALNVTLSELFETVHISLKTKNAERRSNAAKPELKPTKSRLR